jgi:two-component system cell cycle sensor histidine kinase/response regulator CckA
VSMSPLIDRAFPFHITVDRSMVVVAVGPRLRSILKADPIGCALEEIVATDHPQGELHFEALSKTASASQVLQVLDSPGLRLCGEFLLDTDGPDALLRFIGSPWITDLGELKKLGLGLRDFPSHGGLGDLLVLLQTRNNSIDEIRKLAAKLRATSEELAERNQALEEELEARHRLEAQLQQAQKMEAIGRLAGGVAHDFNNILLAITAYTSLALNQSESAGIRDHLERVMEAADRAAGITSRLLSFARRKRLEETSVQLEAAIEESASMLRPLIGEQLNLVVSCKSDAGAIFVDPVALQQVIVNLVVNARDAIVGGGTIELWGERQKSSEAVVLYSGERAPGEWGVISVRDSGAGIDEETLERIFEPFFTTKAMGQGTGLGLATVWWIMTHSNGLIDIKSVPGTGTTISVHFPASHEVAIESKQEEKNSLPSWRILVVEDDPMVRAPLLALLAEEGCDVEAAQSGAEAMNFLESNKKKFDCLLCDIILPDANGRDIALAFKAKYPELRTVLMSGYDPESLNVPADGLAVISKPFSIDDLRIALENAG